MEYFLDSKIFGSRKEDTVVMVVVVDDTPIVIDKLVRVTFAFQKEDTVARKNLSFVEPGVGRIRLVSEKMGKPVYISTSSYAVEDVLRPITSERWLLYRGIGRKDEGVYNLVVLVCAKVNEVRAAYKRALLRFHPYRASHKRVVTTWMAYRYQTKAKIDMEKRILLHIYETTLDTAQAYDEAVRLMRGARARASFPLADGEDGQENLERDSEIDDFFHLVPDDWNHQDDDWNNQGKPVKRKLLYESPFDCHSMGASKKQNVNFDVVDVDTSIMTVDNGIPKPSVVQQRVEPEPLHMVVSNVVEKDLATRDHVDIHGSNYRNMSNNRQYTHCQQRTINL
ncbi:DNA helicase [Tanacetum coccineum]|uniref:DNA helicase n=1 Tax=Tanacetum coccineum TaxID=301880 RepID=A0ABQ5B4G9_9ASTR